MSEVGNFFYSFRLVDPCKRVPSPAQQAQEGLQSTRDRKSIPSLQTPRIFPLVVGRYHEVRCEVLMEVDLVAIFNGSSYPHAWQG
jgi:hypothetical protein